MKRRIYSLMYIILFTIVLAGCQKEPISKEENTVRLDKISCTLSEDGVLDIRGKGEVKPEDLFLNGKDGFDWDTADGIKKIVIHEGITSIGADCFSDFDSVESVWLPEGFIKICENAFQRDVMLKQIHVPDTVECMEDCVFEDCESLEELTLPASLNQYGADVVKGCYRMKKLVNHSSQTWELHTKKMHGTWYCEGQNVDEIAPGKEVYLRSEEYKLTYDLNGGTETKELPNTFTYRDGIELPDTVVRKGYSFAGWNTDDDLELTSVIDAGTKGNQKVRAVWIRFDVEKLGRGKIRAFWDLKDGGEGTKYYEGFSCQIRYSENEDMSDYKFIRTSKKDTEVVLSNLGNEKPYYIEYAVIYELDGWEIDEFPWQGRRQIKDVKSQKVAFRSGFVPAFYEMFSA